MTIPTDTSALPQQIRIVGRWRFLMLFLTTSALVSIYAVAAVADDSLPSNPLPAGHEPYTPTIADPILDARNWTRYPELSGYGLGCLTQATDGAMWFGLEDEVRRYDGLSWTSYTEADGMAGDDTQALLGARDGSVWVGSKTGISRFADGRWTRVLPPAGEIPWTTWSLTERDGEIWAGTDLGLLHLAADGPVLYTGVVSEALRDLFSYLDIRSFADELRPSKGWDTEGAQTLYDYSVEPYWSEATVVDVAAHSPAAAADVRVGDRVVWRKGTEGVRRVIRRGQDTIMVVDPPGAPAVGEASLIQVSDVLPWPDGGLWVGLYPDHLLRFYPDRVDSGGVLLQSLNSGNKGRKLARTRNGTIWFTSGWGAPLQYVDSQGVAVVDTARWSRYVNNSLSILTAADGSLWIGESAGLRVLRGDRWSHYVGGVLPIPARSVVDLHEALDGALWLASSGRDAGRVNLRSDAVTYENLEHVGESDDGATWFADFRVPERSTGFVRRHENTWSRLPDADSIRVQRRGVTRAGMPWIAGDQIVDRTRVAATALYQDGQWVRMLHEQLGERFSYSRETSTGDLWLSAAPGHGLARYRGGQWEYFVEISNQPIHDIAQLPDGSLVTGGVWEMKRLDGHNWSDLDAPQELLQDIQRSVIVDRHDLLWVASNMNGVFRRNRDGTWNRYDVSEGVEHRVTLFLGPDGEAWNIGTDGRQWFVSRFDGTRWVTALEPRGPALRISAHVDSEGALWLNEFPRPEAGTPVFTHRIVLDNQPPETTITLATHEISQPGNVVVSWSGADAWRDTPPEQLSYSWRLDEGDWSAYTTTTTHTLLDLPDGDHALEVLARDRELNVDRTPAVAHFTVVPPVWRQAWFLSLITALLVAIAVQSSRVLRRERRLAEQNQQLTLERAEERVRAEVMSMQSTNDLLRVVGVMHRELIALGFPEASLSQIHHYDQEANPDHWDAYNAFPNPRRKGFTWTSSELIEIDAQIAAASWGFDAPSESIVQRMYGVNRSEEQADKLREISQRVFGRFGIEPLARFAEDAPLHTHYTGIPFSHGALGTRTDRYLVNDEIEILRAFSDALSLGFTRFEDFRQLEQASLNKSQFLRRMSHDLRSPMNAIIGYSRLLRRRLADRMDEREARNLGNIETSSGNLLNLINDILDLSRIEAGRIEVNAHDFDPRNLANECADALESIVKEGVVLQRDLKDVGSINSDMDRLRQVVMNLLGNATKFTETGSITLSVKRDGDAVELSIADTGIGIPPEDLPHIFDEFRQVERQGSEAAEGTGLGLAIAKKTVELLGGSITATSQVGTGTTFVVRLPVTGNRSDV